ncbi:plant UBX domain-containing protein 1 isoform X2 [Cicer arietinum]|uniref:Plant UBX domain-containing protein 1 isoform X2 n=1 Tax=Cicer arietinum TaxID=3827 RepID=A0A1S2XHU4_CICAR|nr:plant UBX domain-containing protein 1 isoform X2 [Cicer arietinum]
MVVDPSFTSKRRRVTNNRYSMETIAKMHEQFGREIRVFETLSLSSSLNAATNKEETDEFYEFTAEDYYKILATKKPDKFLKTRKLREAEEAARRSRITKSVIRVRFPDNHTLEATFHPSETIQSLIDVLNKVIAQPEKPFCLYTTPPKKLIKDFSQDFYTAGFCPGAIVYFSYDVSKGDNNHDGPYLLEEVMSLKGLDVANDKGQPSDPVQSAQVPAEPATQSPAVEERKPAEKKLVKPKWLKM